MAPQVLTRPFIDSLMEALLHGDSERFDHLARHAPPEAARIRAVICSDDAGAVELDLGRGTEAHELVSSFYQGPRAYFLDGLTAIQRRLGHGSSVVLLDHSLGFDSNFAEAIRVLSVGGNLNPTDLARVLSLLRLKANNGHVQFDIMPFLMENLRLVRDNAQNLRPLQTAVAFRLLDRVDLRSVVDDPSALDASRLDEKMVGRIREEQSALITSMLDNDAVRHQEATAIAIQAILLRLVRLLQTGDVDPERLLRALCDYCLDEIGFLPLTELSLIWSGLPDIRRGNFFSPLTSAGAGSVKTARGMAWDMAHLRLLEKAASMSTRGSFFLPSFVSIDERWRRLMNLNPTACMLMLPDGQGGGRVLFGRVKEYEFQATLNKVLKDRWLQTFSQDQVSARRAFAREMPSNVLTGLRDAEASHLGQVPLR